MSQMTNVGTHYCTLCRQELPPTVGDIVHPICAARAEKGLPPMISLLGCIGCGREETRIIFDVYGTEFEICGRCIGAK